MRSTRKSSDPPQKIACGPADGFVLINGSDCGPAGVCRQRLIATSRAYHSTNKAYQKVNVAAAELPQDLATAEFSNIAISYLLRYLIPKRQFMITQKLFQSLYWIV